MIDTDKYEGHTPAPWDYEYGPTLSEDTDDADILTIKTEATFDEDKAWANQRLAADAPLLLEEVKRLQHRLMLAESALGEIRAYHESGSGDLGEIIQHYRDNEGVEMPNAFDEDDDSSYTVEGDD